VVQVTERAAALAPDLLSGDQQAGVVVSLEEVAQNPIGRDHAPGVGIEFGGLQAKAEAESSIGGRLDAVGPALPGLEETGELVLAGCGPLDLALAGPERLPPYPGDIGGGLESWGGAEAELVDLRREAPPIAHGAVDDLAQEAMEHHLRLWPVVVVHLVAFAEQGAAGRGHVAAENLQAGLITRVVENGEPLAVNCPVVGGEPGDEATPSQQFQGELGHQAPVAQIGAQLVIGLLLVVAGRQGGQNVEHVQDGHADALDAPEHETGLGGVILFLTPSLRQPWGQDGRMVIGGQERDAREALGSAPVCVGHIG